MSIEREKKEPARVLNTEAQAMLLQKTLGKLED